jgi:hypothetical protein
VEFPVWSVTDDGVFQKALESFASEEDFKDFIKDRGMQHRRMEDGKEQLLKHVRSLSEAVAASKMEGTRLCLGLSLSASVQKLEGTSKNHASGFEQQTTRAIARDEALCVRFGRLTPVNNGESVLFFREGHKDKFLECDGLLRNSTMALLNEAKGTPSLDHVESLHQKVEKLKMVLANSQSFRSLPPSAMGELEGLSDVEPLLSGYCFNQDIMRVALGKGIICVRTDGKGYHLEGVEIVANDGAGDAGVEMAS